MGHSSQVYSFTCVNLYAFVHAEIFTKNSPITLFLRKKKRKAVGIF
jgi:hypothetical protein